jgi:hypothetical protein
MSKIIIDIPEGVANRIFDSFSFEYKYNSLTDGTKSDFVKKIITQFIKRTVKDYEYSRAIKNAQNQVSADINENINIG